MIARCLTLFLGLLLLAAPLLAADTATPASQATRETAPAKAPDTGAAAPASDPRTTTQRQLDRLRQLYFALRCFDAGEYKRSDEICRRVLVDYPTDTVALTIAGASRMRSNDFQGAVDIFTVYTANHPLEAIGYFYLGLAYHQLGDLERARENYWTATLLDPNLEAARANMKQLDGG